MSPNRDQDAPESTPAVIVPDETILSDEGDALVAGEGDEDDEGDGSEVLIVDIGGDGLVKRGSILLADEAGEWIKGKKHAPAPSTGRVQDLYRAFVSEATRYERLSEEEERALGLLVRDKGDKNAGRKLVVHNLRLAIKMAHQYRRAWTNLMDLVQEASAGMAIAAERWDPDQGTRFGTYAVYWIRAQLTKFLMTNGRIIHTGNTRAGRKLYYQLPKIRRALLAEGKQATPTEIAEVVGEDVREVERIVSRLDGREASLSAPLGGDDGGTLGDVIQSQIEGPEALADANRMQSLMTDLTRNFADRIEEERDMAIWTEHLVSHDPKSLVELGKRFGVSKQRMGQLATRLKRRFRQHVIDELGPTTELSWLFER